MLIALEKLCNQRKFLSKMKKIHSKLKNNCKMKDLRIKFHDKSFDCLKRKRSHFRKYPSKKKNHAKPKGRFFKKKKWKSLRGKKFNGKTSKVYFVCEKPGHFTKNSQKKKKATKLLEQAQIHAKDTPFSYVESLFSLNDEYSPQALVVMGYSTI